MDKMTPKERQMALKSGLEVDRLPITFSHEGYATKIAGMSYREGFNSPEKAAAKEIAVYNRFGVDGVSVSYTSINFAIRHRSKIQSPHDAPAALEEAALKKADQVDQLDLERTSFRRDVAQRTNRGALEILLDQVGDQVIPTYSISAPFTLASGVLAADQMLRATRKDPENLHKLLQFTVDSIKQIIDQVADLKELNYFLYDPVASGSLISPKIYRDFVVPYSKQVVDYIKALPHDHWVGMHICGNTSHSLELIAESGIDGFSLDQEVDLSLAKEKIGDRVTIIGNVDPVKVFLQGDEQAMRQAVRDNFLAAYDSPAGYMIRSGCQVPYATPIEQVDVFMDESIKQATLAADKLFRGGH